MPWELRITRVENGYHLWAPKEDEEEIDREWVLEETEDDLSVHEKLLWEVMEFFNFQGSKHDKERIRVTREKQND